MDPEKLLTQHGVRPTSVRILVLKTMSHFQNTFSMSDLEDELTSVDKSSIFRTLTHFTQHHLVHEIEDGSGSKKYCLCLEDHECGIEDLHCHFYCESCQKTFCLGHTHIPVVSYPEGYELHRIDYLMKGLCPECRKKAASR